MKNLVSLDTVTHTHTQSVLIARIARFFVMPKKETKNKYNCFLNYTFLVSFYF